MKHRHLIALVLSTVALSGCGRDSFLGRAEQSCLKYPTPAARMECEQRANEVNDAFEKETQKNRDQAKARAAAELKAQEPAGSGVAGDAAVDTKSNAPDAVKTEPQKKNGLCFKRAATGEVVCPN
jgi:hypothetical protein